MYEMRQKPVNMMQSKSKTSALLLILINVLLVVHVWMFVQKIVLPYILLNRAKCKRKKTQILN